MYQPVNWTHVVRTNHRQAAHRPQGYLPEPSLVIRLLFTVSLTRTFCQGIMRQSPIRVVLNFTLGQGSGSYDRGCSWFLPVTRSVQLTLEQATKAQRGEDVQLYSFFNLGNRWGGWSKPRPGRFTHCIVGWVGPRVDLDGCGKSRPPTEIRSPDLPARRVSQYRLGLSRPTTRSVGENFIFG